MIKGEQKKRVRIEAYSCFLSGHILPMLKLLTILQKENPHFDIVFLLGTFAFHKFQKSFPHIKMVEINDNFTQEDYQQSMSNHVASQIALSAYLTDYFANKIDKPDLIISDFFVVEGFKWANKNGVKYIINLPCSYKTTHLVFSSMNTDFSWNF